jgi:hypothetical protein
MKIFQFLKTRSAVEFIRTKEKSQIDLSDARLLFCDEHLFLSIQAFQEVGFELCDLLLAFSAGQLL